MERIPPHSEEAERSAIGAAMLSKDALLDVAEEVRPEDFYNESNKEIFDAILKLYRNNTAVDLLTVSEELSKRKTLDMVGGSNATFLYEGFSEEYAHDVNRKVWKTANDLGYGKYFVKDQAGYVTDDHLFVNRYAKIPTIDIVPSTPDGFYKYWHTVKDDINGIDRNTLKAVGQTVMQVIYEED